VLKHRGALSTAAVVVLVVTSLNIFARGFGETYTVFLLPLQDQFGWTRATLTSVYSLHMFMIGISSPIAGMIFDRFGPRVAYGVGILAIGIGSLGASTATGVWQFYIFIGLLAGFGGGAIGIVSAAALVRRWVESRLGTAMGIAYAGLGLGIMLLVPSAQLLIENYGWRDAYRMIGIFVLTLFPLVMLLPWGRFRDGDPTIMSNAALSQTSGSSGARRLRRAMGEISFWGMFNVYFFTSLCVYVTNVQVVVFLVEKGFEPLFAASAFGIAGMLSIVGVISSGWMTDKVGYLGASLVTYAFTIGGIGALILVNFFPVMAVVFLYVFALGMFQGSRGPIVSTIASKVYGGIGYGAIFGAINLGMGIGASIGSWISGLLYDVTGGYTTGFVCAMIFGLIALGQFIFVRALRHGKVERAHPL